MLHKEILSPSQQALLPLLRKMEKDFTLCGGTAIALQLGHRESIDFDLFTNGELDVADLRKKISEVDRNFIVLVKNNSEYTVVVKGVKMTFLSYPFPFKADIALDGTIHIADVLTLSAMKAYALGRRSKWKDYVDLFFILSKQYSLKQVIEKSKQIFGGEFNEKIFRSALAYFEDIDYTESVIFRPGFEADIETIQSVLKKISVSEE